LEKEIFVPRFTLDKPKPPVHSHRLRSPPSAGPAVVFHAEFDIRSASSIARTGASRSPHSSSVQVSPTTLTVTQAAAVIPSSAMKKCSWRACADPSPQQSLGGDYVLNQVLSRSRWKRT
jgi:hypothetical protein